MHSVKNALGRQKQARRFGGRSAGAVATSEKKKIDVVLQRIVWVAQLGLFFTAVAGYFLTVRPAYQKQLLDEQIAERTVKLRETTLTLETLQAEASNLKSENARLTEESNSSYLQLRANLMAELNLVASSCTYGIRPDLLNGTELRNCVVDYANKNIVKFLRQVDREKVKSALTVHSQKIVELPQKIERSRVERLRKARSAKARYDAALKKSESDFVAAIANLRGEEKGVALKSVKDIKAIRGQEEAKLYNMFVDAHNELSNKLLDAEFAVIDTSSNVRSELHEALRDITRKIRDELKF